MMMNIAYHSKSELLTGWNIILVHDLQCNGDSDPKFEYWLRTSKVELSNGATPPIIGDLSDGQMLTY
jgi:hypothetical protein